MKTRIPTFLTGMFTMLLLGTLTISALAISGRMTIEVDPVNIQVNGVTFQPKDAGGNDVPVFAYNGTTYAPLRALAEAYGLDVWYDSDSNMASVGPKGSMPGGNAESISQETLTVEPKSLIRIFEVTEPGVNSAGGVSFAVFWNNFSGKSIKYIRFYATPYNRVGDLLKCDITKQSTVECYSTGPFENVTPTMDWSKNQYCYPTDDEAYATIIQKDGTFTGYGGIKLTVDWDNMYNTFLTDEWENVWYNYDVTEVKLSKIVIEFMDGSSATLTGDTLQQCFW